MHNEGRYDFRLEDVLRLPRLTEKDSEVMDVLGLAHSPSSAQKKSLLADYGHLHSVSHFIQTLH